LLRSLGVNPADHEILARAIAAGAIIFAAAVNIRGASLRRPRRRPLDDDEIRRARGVGYSRRSCSARHAARASTTCSRSPDPFSQASSTRAHPRALRVTALPICRSRAAR
jgi:hypothetical protein